MGSASFLKMAFKVWQYGRVINVQSERIRIRKSTPQKNVCGGAVKVEIIQEAMAKKW